MKATEVEEGGSNIINCKCVNELVLDRCSELMFLDGSLKLLTENDKTAIKSEATEKFVKISLRTVTTTYREMKGVLPEENKK